MGQGVSNQVACMWKKCTTRLLYWLAGVPRSHVANGPQSGNCEEAALDHVFSQLVDINDALYAMAFKAWA
jgi:hypothetical protein